MISIIRLSKDQEAQLKYIYEKREETGTSRELVQGLFEEALTANFLTYSNMDEARPLHQTKQG